MKNEKITLSINPSYKCNLRCDFCYLSNEQLASSTVTHLDSLFERLSEVSSHRRIDHVDLYGGEIALLGESYLNAFERTLRYFYQGQINIISNLTVVPSFFLRDDVDLSVSWDFFAREQYKKTYANMFGLKKDFRILVLASDRLVKMTEIELDQFISLLNELPRLLSVEIKPYSINQYNLQGVTYLEYEEWIKRWLKRIVSFRFDFINLNKIEASLGKKYSSWSDEHLYITPSGKFAVLEFDELNKEYFMELESYAHYEDWIGKERNLVKSNSYCGSCEYLGSCLSEHLQPVHDLTQSCNGFRNLLDWYKHERL